jgi:hypothetical protein
MLQVQIPHFQAKIQAFKQYLPIIWDNIQRRQQLFFCGVQDNGTVRYTGEECWTGVGAGDGGHCIVNWE